jgi:hypothetical protein
MVFLVLRKIRDGLWETKKTSSFWEKLKVKVLEKVEEDLSAQISVLYPPLGGQVIYIE